MTAFPCSRILWTLVDNFFQLMLLALYMSIHSLHCWPNFSESIMWSDLRVSQIFAMPRIKFSGTPNILPTIFGLEKNLRAVFLKLFFIFNYICISTECPKFNKSFILYQCYQLLINIIILWHFATY